MPKKKHQTKYARPQSTAPSSLGTSSSRPTTSANKSNKGVNDLLANLRRGSLASSNHTSSSSATASGTSAGAAAVSAHSSASFVSATGSGAAPGTLPPSLRQLLQIPETPSPPPRRPARTDASGRRLPPGPRPPRSWIEQGPRRGASGGLTRRTTSLSGPRSTDDAAAHFHRLPGAYAPEHGSLVDLLLRKMSADWEFQSVYNHYYLTTLQSRLRSSLIAYLGNFLEVGVTVGDLRLILLPPKDILGDVEEQAPGHSGQDSLRGGDDVVGMEQRLYSEAEALHSLNHDFFHLDLSGSIGHSITVKELSEFLFPPQLARSPTPEEIQESWDDATSFSSSPNDNHPSDLFGYPSSSVPRPPRLLLPQLTHLSLAVEPSFPGTRFVSWKHLLALAAKMPSITHLSLAYWPEPSLTPHSKFRTVEGGTPDGRAIQYSGTGPYAHSLDNDWSEAIILLRKLCKSLYELEYLDLTGCGAWFGALMHDCDGDRLDWEGHWGKVSTLRLMDGYGISPDTIEGDKQRVKTSIATAERVERYVVARRAGRGRFIDVQRDSSGTGLRGREAR